MDFRPSTSIQVPTENRIVYALLNDKNNLITIEVDLGYGKEMLPLIFDEYYNALKCTKESDNPLITGAKIIQVGISGELNESNIS